jgi:GT2 family glycosyltransferase
MNTLVSVTIVTHNCRGFIGACLESVLAQDRAPLEVIVVENASADGTPAELERFAGKIELISSPMNLGFAAGQNLAIRHSRGAWVLALNPDAVLAPDFLTRLLAEVEAQGDPAIGSACGRLQALPENLDTSASRHLDSAGMYFTPELRHLDRGCRQPDGGEYRQTEYVFGATGAAALYRRAMIEAISPEGEFFDEDFFAYREDADVAWRAQLLGWKCLYVPAARGYHVRTCLPSNRRDLPAAINMHSVKNRFLIRIKNMTADLYRRHWLAITWRDLCVVGYCVLAEHSSLRAFALLRRNWKRAWAKRRWIQERRRVSDAEIARWFQAQPAAEPARSPAAAASRT